MVIGNPTHAACQQARHSRDLYLGARLVIDDGLAVEKPFNLLVGRVNAMIEGPCAQRKFMVSDKLHPSAAPALKCFDLP